MHLKEPGRKRVRAKRRRTLLSGVMAAVVLAMIVPSVVHAAKVDDTGRCARPAASGRTAISVFAGYTWRTFLLYVPKRYDGVHRIPLVLDLHGTGGTGARQLAASQLEATADEHTFAVAAPDGGVRFGAGFAWNVPGVPLFGGYDVPWGTPDDVDYLGTVIDKVRGLLCVDTKRVYSTGYSSGARMTSYLGCALADRVAAIAPVAGLRAGAPDADGRPAPGSCVPRRPVPVITFHGMADRTNPYGSGGQPYWRYGVGTAATQWAELDGCARQPRVTRVTEHVSLTTYSSCRDKVLVKLYSIKDAGHTWPGSSFKFPKSAGTTNGEVVANELIWNFFAEHPLGRSGAMSAAFTA